MTDIRKWNTAVLLMLIFCVTCTNCNFQVTPPAIVSECVNKAVTLTWTIESFMSVGFVRWNYNLTTLIMRQIGPTTTPVPQGSYVGRVENGSNSDLIIKSPLTSDTGGYQCSVTYSNGTQVLSDVVSLYIYDNWAVTLNITVRKNGQSATLTSNVDDPAVQQTWSTGAQGPSITVTKDGVYTLCISGGRAKCLDPSSTNCTSYNLKIEACGSFHCGFWLLLLVHVVTSIIISILMWKKVKRFGFSASGCSNMKIGITVVFSVVAIGTGLGLGLGLREGQANCLECGATIGISIALGVALSVIEFIVIIKCDKEKVSVFRAVINITSESYTDDLKDCTSRAYKDLSRRVTKAIESLYKNVPGQQTVVDLKFSPGLKVTFDLISQEFDDCSELSDTLNNALQSGLISPFKVSSVGFEFMPLQDWKDSKRETSDRSNGDRARSPASASAIKVEAENKSHIKPTGKKTEESSLHIKSYGSPLPEVPKVRHNQLDPIPKSDNGEMDNSHNKPYTKLPEVPQGRSIPLVPIQGQDIDEMESPKVEKKKKKKKKKRREDSVDNEEDN